MSEHLDEGTIHAWLDGQLSPDESARIEAHMAGCEPCSALVAEARGYVAAASRIAGALDGVPAKVLPATRRGIRPWQLRVAAAVVVMVLGTAIYLREPSFNSARVSSPVSQDVVSLKKAAVDSPATLAAKAQSLDAKSSPAPALAESRTAGRPAAPSASPSATALSAPTPQLQSASGATPGAAGGAMQPPSREMAAAKAVPSPQAAPPESFGVAADRATNAAAAAEAAPAAQLPRARLAPQMASPPAPTTGATDNLLKNPQQLGDVRVNSPVLQSTGAPTVTFPRATLGAATGPSVCTGLVISIATRQAADSVVGQTITVRLGGPVYAASEGHDTATSGGQARSATQPQPAPIAISQTGSWMPLGPDSAIVVVMGSGAPAQTRVSCRQR